MKNFKTILAELPSQTAVFVFGRMNPASAGHGLVIEKTKQVAKNYNAPHFIYLSHSIDPNKNPLSKDKKLYWAKKLFPNTNFVNSNVKNFLEAATELNKKYRHLIMIAGSDRVDEYRAKLNKYNGSEFFFESIKVISAGERNSDFSELSGISGTYLREQVSLGNLDDFRRGIPSMLEVDARRYFNDIREGMSLEPIKNKLIFESNPLREKYISGGLFDIGDIVESNGEKYEILSCGTNYVSIVKDGIITRKWLSEVHATDERKIFEDSIILDNVIHFKGYITKNFTKEIVDAFYPLIESKKDAVAILTAIKSTDSYLDKNNNMLTFKEHHDKAKEYLTKLGVMEDHPYIESYDVLDEVLSDKTIKTTDKLKVARIIGTFLSVDNAESMSSPTTIVNMGLRNLRKLPSTKETKKILTRILQLAKTADIEFDEKLIPAPMHESKHDDEIKDDIDVKTNNLNTSTEPEEKNDVIINPEPTIEHPLPDTIRRQKRNHRLGESDDASTDSDLEIKQGIDDDEYELSDNEIDAMLAHIDDWDDIIDVYDDDELQFVDPETGEPIDDDEFEEIDESLLMEVLTRQERIRAKMRMRKTKSKRERGAKLALKRFSSSTVINKRARRLAIKVLKRKMTQGRDPKSLSVAEKERLERIIAKRKSTINRIAMKMVAKVRKVEKDRMSARSTKS